MIDKEQSWTTGLRNVEAGDENLPTEVPVSISNGEHGLSGYVWHRENSKTAMPTDLIDDYIHDQSRNFNLGNIHNHGITTARETLARSTYSCHRVNDNIDGIQGFSELDLMNGLDEKEKGDEFEGGAVTYVVPFVIACGATYMLYKALNEDD